MTRALITVNAVAGSNTDLVINTLTQLSNSGNGGEATYLWTVVDQPPGTADNLSSTTIQSPTLTPKKEGTYLIDLVVNLGLADEARNRVVCVVRHLKTRVQSPAAHQTSENGTRGWAAQVGPVIDLVDAMRADPGIIVAQAAATLAVNDVVHGTGSATIKSGLPGQEKVPILDKALATQAYILTDELYLVVGAVDGGSITVGKLFFARAFGMHRTAVSISAAVALDTVYVSDTATLSRTVGTNTRRVGKVLAVNGGLSDVNFNGFA